MFCWLPAVALSHSVLIAQAAIIAGTDAMWLMPMLMPMLFLSTASAMLIVLAAALSHFLCSQRKLLSAFVALVHAACLAREVVHAVCLCSRIHVHGMFMFHGISCFGPVFRSVSLLNLVFGAFFFHGSFMFRTIVCSQKHFNN